MRMRKRMLHTCAGCILQLKFCKQHGNPPVRMTCLFSFPCFQDCQLPGAGHWRQTAGLLLCVQLDHSLHVSRHAYLA